MPPSSIAHSCLSLRVTSEDRYLRPWLRHLSNSWQFMESYNHVTQHWPTTKINGMPLLVGMQQHRCRVRCKCPLTAQGSCAARLHAARGAWSPYEAERSLRSHQIFFTSCTISSSCSKWSLPTCMPGGVGRWERTQQAGLNALRGSGAVCASCFTHPLANMHDLWRPCCMAAM